MASIMKMKRKEEPIMMEVGKEGENI